MTSRYTYHQMPEGLTSLARAMFMPGSLELLRGARVQPQSGSVSAAVWIMGLRHTESGERQLVAFLVEWTLQGVICSVSRHRVVNYDPNHINCILEYECFEAPAGEMAQTLQEFALSAGLI